MPHGGSPAPQGPRRRARGRGDHGPPRVGRVGSASRSPGLTRSPSGTASGPGAPAPSGTDVSPEVAQQIQAVTDEKADRTPTEQKLDSNLLYAAREDASEPAVEGAPDITSDLDTAGGTVLVDIDASVTPGLTASIEAAGGEVVAAVPGFDAVRAEVPVGAVVDLAGRPDITAIRPADQPTTSAAGSGGNEGDATHAADTARARYDVDGSGIKVCVLSDGVASLAERQATGDLPAVDVLPGQAGASSADEGTAMLELIHDVAPGAELGFATAFTSQASFAQNILNLKADGCKVMVDDVTWYAETTLQDDDVAQAVNAVRAGGVTYFSSAGNSGNLPDGTSGTWQGDFQDTGPSAAPLPTGLRVHGWGTGATSNALTKVDGPLNLQWADPVGGSANDYDLYVLDERGHLDRGVVHQRAERCAGPGGVDHRHRGGRQPRRGDQVRRRGQPLPGALHERGDARDRHRWLGPRAQRERGGGVGGGHPGGRRHRCGEPRRSVPGHVLRVERERALLQ